MIKKLRNIVQFGIYGILGVALTFSALGQENAPISISSVVDKSTIRIGDLIRYTVTVTHDPGVQIQLPGQGANLGGFDIRSYEARDPRKEDGKIITESQYVISTFLTGEFEIPPLTILYALAGDTAAQTLSTDPIQIMVESIKPSEEGDIRDIKPPEEIPRNWWLTLRWIGLVVLILAFIIFDWIGYRRRKAGKSLLPIRETPLKPPHEIALEALDRLDPDGLGEDSVLIKAFYTEVSDIVRKYIEGRYFVTALEMTTREVLEGLYSAEVEADIQSAIQNLLEACDLVKFAKMIPPESRHREVLNLARDIVNRTKIMLDLSTQEQSESDLVEETVPAGVASITVPDAEQEETR